MKSYTLNLPFVKYKSDLKHLHLKHGLMALIKVRISSDLKSQALHFLSNKSEKKVEPVSYILLGHIYGMQERGQFTQFIKP